MFFDQKCLGACGCQFSISSLDAAALKSKHDNLTSNLDSMGNYLGERKDEAWTMIQPALDDYLKKEATLHDQFAQLLKDHAPAAFGCDAKCIEDCLNKTFITFYEIP